MAAPSRRLERSLPMNEPIHANREYKDSVFRMLYNNPEMRSGRSQLSGGGGTGCDGMYQERNPGGFPSQSEIGGNCHVDF